MSKTTFAQGQLKSFIDRIERLEEEKATITGDIKEVYAEAKGTGLDTKILRKVIALRKMDQAERQEQEAMLDVYLAALGMQPSLFDETETSEASASGSAGAAGGKRSGTASVDPPAATQSTTAVPPEGQHGDPTDETADAVSSGGSVEVLTVKSAEAVQPIPETQPTAVPIAPAVQEAGVETPAEPPASHQSEDMPDIPKFLDRRKRTAGDFLAAG